MAGDRARSSIDATSDQPPKAKPPHGRTTGPTRRSTKGQWTAEEDSILSKAVQTYKGKNWKKIAEIFPDRTDVQCLHRWQKVLNPELVKGPWSKEEDDVIIEMVNKVGAKKWTLIAQALPGRIGKQCRERWHNNLNPTINRQAWTQEEEMALIQAHQIYGNKWAELTNILPGRTDNAIKNHWNSSVKKKLDFYLSSGLLAQFQGLPRTENPSHCKSSCSEGKQKSGSENGLKDVAEVEESSGHTQSSAHSNYDTEKIRINENGDSSDQEIAQDPNFTCLEEYNNSIEYAKHVFPHAQGFGICVDTSNQNLYAETALSGPPEGSISSFMEEPQRSSGLSEMPEYCQVSDSNHGSEQLCPVSSSGFNIPASLDNNDSSTDKQIGLQFPEIDYSCNNHAGSTILNGFSLGDPVAASPFIGTESNANSTICNTGTQNTEANNMFDSTSQSYHPVCSSDMLCIPCSEGLDIDPSSFICSGDGKLMLPNNFDGGNDSLQAQDSEFTTCMHNELINLLGSMVPSSGGGDCNVDVHLQTSKTPEKEVSRSKDTETFERHAYPENSVAGFDHLNSESLCYEPPRFPSVDFPFVTCDLISSADLQQAYSPLGIRQLTMSSFSHSSPYNLWDSSSREGSPDVVLRNAAKSFLHTPSILKKRQHELLSPLHEMRSDKKSERGLNQDLLCTVSNRNACSSKDITCNGGETCDGSYTSSNKTFSPYHQKRKYVHVCPQEQKESFGHAQKESQDQTTANNGKSFKGLSDSDLQRDGVASGCDMLNKINTNRTGSILVEHEISSHCLSSPEPDDLTENSEKKSIDERKQLHDVPLKSSEPCSEKSRSSIDADFEKLNIFDDTPGIKRSIESPSAWKSPWFMNDGFPIGKRITASAAFEDFAYLLSHGNDDNNSFDAIGLMRHLSEHNAVALTEGHEILRGGNSTKSHSNDVCSKPADSFTTNNHRLQDGGGKENCIHLLPNTMMEGRVLDFSECGMPSKENAGEVENIHRTSPDSYRR